MIFPLEDRWGILSILEYEHGAKKALLSLHRKHLLQFGHTDAEQQERFLSEIASTYAVSAFRQGKEFFRHAETSSWLVKPLLLYYGMLAVAKAGLVFQSPDYFTDAKNLGHGVGSGDRAKAAADFQNEYVEIRKAGMYPLVRAALEHETFPEGTQLRLAEILTRLPEVDATYRLVFHRQDDPLNYVKVWGNVFYRDPEDNRVHMGFQLPMSVFESIRGRLPIEITGNVEIKTVDVSGQPMAGFRSTQSWDNEAAAVEVMPRVLTRTLDQNFALILPIEIEGKQYRVSEVELIYLATFYLSSLARYQPHLWLEMQAGADNLAVLLCQDLLRSSENKFLGLAQRELHYAGLLPLVETAQAVVAPGPNR